MIKVIGAIIDIIFEVSNELIAGIFGFITSLFEKERKTEYTADFISERNILKKRDTGFCLTGEYSLSIIESYKNAIVLGGSGSGKSSTVLINSALYMMHGNSSLIFNDPSHEIRILVSGALRQVGYEIKVIDYSDEKSECFNPLKRCQSISDIQKLSSLLVRNALGEAKDPFWNKSAEALLSLLIRYLIFYAKPEYRTLHNVLYLVNVLAGSPEKIDKLIVYSKDEKLLSEYKAFISFGDKTLSSIIATAKAALSIFTDDTIANITSHDTIDFKEFRSNKIALFINNSIPTMHYYSGISSLFFQQFMNEILIKLPGQSENNIFFLLDEAGAMYLPSLSTIISNIRKYNSGILLIYQDQHIVDHIYGSYESKNILANCYAKVYLPGQPIETCKILETTLGIFEYLDDNEVRRTRPLMTADEIRMSEKAIVLLGNKMPIHATLHPFYKNQKLKALTEIAPYVPDNILPFDIPPLIQFGDEKKT